MTKKIKGYKCKWLKHEDIITIKQVHTRLDLIFVIALVVMEMKMIVNL